MPQLTIKQLQNILEADGEIEVAQGQVDAIKKQLKAAAEDLKAAFNKRDELCHEAREGLDLLNTAAQEMGVIGPKTRPGRRFNIDGTADRIEFQGIDDGNVKMIFADGDYAGESFFPAAPISVETWNAEWAPKVEGYSDPLEAESQSPGHIGPETKVGSIFTINESGDAGGDEKWEFYGIDEDGSLSFVYADGEEKGDDPFSDQDVGVETWNAEWAPLVKSVHPPGDDIAAGATADIAAGATGWREVLLADLGGPDGGEPLSDAVLRILSDAGLETVGELEDFRAKHGTSWTKPLKGIGPTAAGHIEDSLLAFYATRGGDEGQGTRD